MTVNFDVAGQLFPQAFFKRHDRIKIAKGTATELENKLMAHARLARPNELS